MRNKAVALIIVWILICLLKVTGCVYVPKTDTDEDDEKCQLKTRSLTLDVYNLTPEYTAAADDMHQLIQGNCTEAECLLIVLLTPIAISAGSFIVSGSIIVAGNTVHWIEKQGKCDDSATNKAISSLVDATKIYGGQVIETGRQLIEWLEEQLSYGESYEPMLIEGAK